MEHWDVLKPGGYRFVWDDALFPPGTDTFLLSSLPRLKPNLRVCDLGCGTGLLGLLLLQRQGNLTVTGVELQPEAAALLERASAENGLEGRLTVCRGDLRNIRALLPAGGFDLVVCNPPYYPAGTGKLSPAPALQTARAETACTLKDVCRAAGWLLRWGGAFCLVHKPERLTDLLCALRAAALEPKRLRTVERRAGDAPSLILAEARRGGRPGLSWEPPLILETAEGRPTEELDRIYFRQEDMP
jgi:tRNA1(Val) A37 N6-methylase TrmN6